MAIAGRVVDETGQGVDGAAVTLLAPEGEPGVLQPRRIDRNLSAASDRDGRFEIDAVAPGTYELTCGMGMLHGRLIAE